MRVARNRYAWLFVVGALMSVGCGDDDDRGGTDAGPRDSGPGAIDSGPDPVDAGPPPDSGPVDAGQDAGPVDAGPPRDCGDPATRPVVPVTGEITSSTMWTCDNIYELRPSATFGPVYVVNNSTLTVEAGTIVRGQTRDLVRRCGGGTRMGMTCTTADENATTGCPGAAMTCTVAPSDEGTALVIARGSRLVAEGTAERPIVFTSSRLGTATAPAPGNWGGIVLLGDAPTNNDPPNMAQIEGLPPAEGRGLYGGANAAGSCGTLRYVRVEYAGYIFGRNNELNGITLGGCGGGTLLDHVQVHRGLDDGIEFFGGSANARYIVVTGTGDDSLDYDLGYTGNVQFFIGQQRNAPGEDRCIEGDNHPSSFSRTPLTRPTVFNFTCVGPGERPGVRGTAGLSQDGMVIRRGSSGVIQNSIFAFALDRGIQVDDVTTAMTEADPVANLYANGMTVIGNNIVWRTGADAMTNYFDIDASTTPAMTSDALEAMAAEDNRVVDPGLPASASMDDAPSFVPAAGSASATGAAATPTAPAGFWTPANYIGAVEPGTATPWYAGWTRFTP